MTSGVVARISWRPCGMGEAERLDLATVNADRLTLYPHPTHIGIQSNEQLGFASL